MRETCVVRGHEVGMDALAEFDDNFEGHLGRLGEQVATEDRRQGKSRQFALR